MEPRSWVGLAAASNAMLVALPTYGPLTARNGLKRLSGYLDKKTQQVTGHTDSLPICENMYSTFYSFVLTSRSLKNFPFLYEMTGGSLKIWRSRGWFWINCHFVSTPQAFIFRVHETWTTHFHHAPVRCQQWLSMARHSRWRNCLCAAHARQGGK